MYPVAVWPELRPKSNKTREARTAINVGYNRTWISGSRVYIERRVGVNINGLENGKKVKRGSAFLLSARDRADDVLAMINVVFFQLVIVGIHNLRIAKKFKLNPPVTPHPLKNNHASIHPPRVSRH